MLRKDWGNAVRIRPTNFAIAAAIFFPTVGAGAAFAQTVTLDHLTGPSFAAQATVQSVTDNTTADAVTLSGGGLLTAESWLPADQTTVYYDSFLLNPTTSNVMTVTFATPVTNFSIDIYNGQNTTDTFAISNGLGETVDETIGPNNAGGFALASIAQGGTVFTITDLNATGYDFSIDNLGFTIAGGLPGGSTGVPEPSVWSLMVVATGFLGGALRRNASFRRSRI